MKVIELIVVLVKDLWYLVTFFSQPCVIHLRQNIKHIQDKVF